MRIQDRIKKEIKYYNICILWNSEFIERFTENKYLSSLFELSVYFKLLPIAKISFDFTVDVHVDIDFFSLYLNIINQSLSNLTVPAL